MVKRARTGGLTGGTGDVNPQFLQITVNETALNTFTAEEWRLPLMKVGTSSQRAQVIEILRIFAQHNYPDIPAAMGASTVTWGLKWGGQPTVMPPFDDTTIIVQDYSPCVVAGIPGAGEAYAYMRDQPSSITQYDLTDGAGHGYICFVDRLWVYIEGAGNTGAKFINLKMYFRFKNVGMPEFISGLTAQHA